MSYILNICTVHKVCVGAKDKSSNKKITKQKTSGTKKNSFNDNKVSYDEIRRKIEPGFKPSMGTLLRITKSMLEHGEEGKTSLSLDTNLNYTRLAKHIVWLEKKGLVESTIKDTRINVGLTEKGKVFASIILNGKQDNDQAKRL